MDIVMVYLPDCAVQLFIKTIVVCSRLQLRHAILLRFFFLDMTKHLVVFLKITEKYLRNAKISN